MVDKKFRIIGNIELSICCAFHSLTSPMQIHTSSPCENSDASNIEIAGTYHIDYFCLVYRHRIWLDSGIDVPTLPIRIVHMHGVSCRACVGVRALPQQQQPLHGVIDWYCCCSLLVIYIFFFCVVFFSLLFCQVFFPVGVMTEFHHCKYHARLISSNFPRKNVFLSCRRG